LGGLLYIPVSLLFFLIGTALFAYYQSYPTLLPADLQSYDAADRVFPYFIVSGLPKGITGLLLASIFAAGMSTISTSLNSGATILHSDFYLRLFKKGSSDKSSMRFLYIASGIIGVLGIVVALAMTNAKSALDAWWALSSIFSGGMLGLFLLGFMFRRLTSLHAVIGTVGGVLVIAWISLSPIYFNSELLQNFKSSLHPNLAIVAGTMTIFVLGFLALYLIKRK
jgi:SSS family solute:Na+ symporter